MKAVFLCAYVVQYNEFDPFKVVLQAIKIIPYRLKNSPSF